MLRIMLVAAVALAMTISVSAQITLVPENRCSPYDRSDYSYPQSIELRIIAENLDGQIISPYTGEVFTSRSQTDIEHIVATSEAHDSGLCAATAATRRGFAQDLDNLTLASPSLNRHQKSGKDLAEWRPAENVCWFAQTVVHVKAKYSLSMDDNEASAAVPLLKRCNPRADCQSLNSVDTLNCYAGIAPANTVSAPASNTSCFASDTAYLAGAMNIRSQASVNSEKVGMAQPGSYAVSGSAQGASYCWLNIGSGWIAKTSLVSAATTASQPPARQQSPARVQACFLYDTAYVTGAMNVRSQASVNGSKIGLAQPGTYSVAGSAQGQTYCWVNIGTGWIAKTARVSGTKPVSSRSSQPVSQPAARQTSQQSTQTQQQPAQPPAQQAPAPVNALALYDNNGNGRITCAEARSHGIAPVSRGHPAYQYMDDRDNDGFVCE